MHDELDSTPDTARHDASFPATAHRDRSQLAARSEAVRHERVLELAPDEAWELLGTSAGLERWLGDRVDLDIEPGAKGTITDGGEALVTEVESVEDGRRVSLRWWSDDRGATVVDLTLEPLGAARTRLVVIEIPVRTLDVPAVHPFTGTSDSDARPTMLAGSRALAMA